MAPVVIEVYVIAQNENESSINSTEDFLRSIVDTVRNPLLVLDKELRVVAASRAFHKTFDLSQDETDGRLVYDLGGGQWDIPELKHLLEDILPNNSEFDEYEVKQTFPPNGNRVMLLNGRKLYRPGNHTEMILLSIEDVTERTAKQVTLQKAYERERRIAQALQRPLMFPIDENAFPNLSIATFYEPARRNEADVGGDFFDAFALPGGKIALVIADASGKGLEAAARTMQVKDVLRAFTLEYPHIPAHIIARLNDYVNESHFEEDNSENSSVLLWSSSIQGAGRARRSWRAPNR
jgi:PAS domain S-box-containing protein